MPRRTIAAALAAISIAAAAPASDASTPTPAQATVHAACTRAHIEGDRVCIAAGQFCRHRRSANRDYHRYGYHCGKRDRNGNYHLVRR
jgi:hypothetical protein